MKGNVSIFIIVSYTEIESKQDRVFTCTDIQIRQFSNRTFQIANYL